MPAKATMRWRAPLALLAGLVHASSFAPFPTGWVQLLAMAAAWSLVVGLGRRPGLARTGQAAWVGLLFGLGTFTAGLCWLYVSMHDFGGMPAPLAALAVVLLSAYLALFGALAFALAHRWRGSGAAPSWRTAVLLGALWGGGEIVRAYLFTGFPWLSIGYAHVEGPLFALAPLAGIYGIGVLAAAAVAAFVGALHAIRPATTRA
ncbi:MAG: apolipoprotein N-acyltransferase, partial [Burkholderiaceae bacterium]